MSTWDEELSVSSCAAVLSAVTVIASLAVTSWSVIVTSRGSGRADVDVRCTGWKPWTSDVQLVGVEGHVEELERAVGGGGGLRPEAGDVVAELERRRRPSRRPSGPTTRPRMEPAPAAASTLRGEGGEAEQVRTSEMRISTLRLLFGLKHACPPYEGRRGTTRLTTGRGAVQAAGGPRVVRTTLWPEARRSVRAGRTAFGGVEGREGRWRSSPFLGRVEAKRHARQCVRPRSRRRCGRRSRGRGARRGPGGPAPRAVGSPSEGARSSGVRVVCPPGIVKDFVP